MCSILIVHSVPYITFPYFYTLVYRSSFTGACHCLWGCSCTFSSGSSVSLVCTFLCVPCGTYGLRCSLLQWYTTRSGVLTLYDWWPRYSWIMAGCHLFSGGVIVMTDNIMSDSHLGENINWTQGWQFKHLLWKHSVTNIGHMKSCSLS